MQQANVQRRNLVLRLAFLAFCLLSVVCGLPPGAFADIQQPAKGRTKGEREQQKLAQRIAPPPTPVATRVRLEPGGRAEIILQATGALGRTVDFLLRTPPAHGGFEGVPRRLGRDRVAVTYVHRAADGTGHDLFTFAAQAPGTPVSAAETVDIGISEPAPSVATAAPTPTGASDLAATPADLDFGAVEAGRSTGVTLTLENRGGGEASGRLEVPAPWSVEGDSSYRLTHSARQAFRVVFRPAEAGSFAETLSIGVDGGDRTAGCVVRLVGTGLAAAAAAPSPAASAAPVSTPVPVAAASPTPRPAAVEARPEPHGTPGVADPGAFIVNEASVEAVETRAVGTTAVELAWKPPVPLPQSYRVERRSFARDDAESDGVRIDWTLWDRTEIRVHANEVTATLRGLRPGEFMTLRVVAVDTAGRLASPSPEVNLYTVEASAWWRLTPLKILLLALAACLGMLARQRWQERQLLRELEDPHTSDERPLFTAPRE